MNMRKHFTKATYYLANADSRLTEFWFGMQALGTSFLSLTFVGQDLSMESKILLSLNALFAIPQIVFSLSDLIKIRHWSNWITSILSFTVSVSMMAQFSQQVSIFGYAFLGIATLHCSFLTNRKIHGQKNQNDFIKNNDE